MRLCTKDCELLFVSLCAAYLPLEFLQRLQSISQDLQSPILVLGKCLWETFTNTLHAWPDTKRYWTCVMVLSKERTKLFPFARWVGLTTTASSSSRLIALPWGWEQPSSNGLDWWFHPEPTGLLTVTVQTGVCLRSLVLTLMIVLMLSDHRCPGGIAGWVTPGSSIWPRTSNGWNTWTLLTSMLVYRKICQRRLRHAAIVCPILTLALQNLSSWNPGARRITYVDMLKKDTGYTSTDALCSGILDQDVWKGVIPRAWVAPVASKWYVKKIWQTRLLFSDFYLFRWQ